VRIFVEGPWWAGRWTDITVAALQQLGHETACYYHNRKSPADRARLAAGRLAGLAGGRVTDWHTLARRRLSDRVQEFRPDLLISIQGKLDLPTAQALKRRSPNLRIVFWWGDILTPQGQRRIEAAAAFADRILVSYRGSHETLAPRHGEQLLYFPFAAAPRFHTAGTLTAAERRRLAADVAFIGTCYPERCELIRYLNARLEQPVRVWGRGWRRCHGVRGLGALSLADCMKVYANARVTASRYATGNRLCRTPRWAGSPPPAARRRNTWSGSATHCSTRKNARHSPPGRMARYWRTRPTRPGLLICSSN
jgi:hypothetical protein